MGHPLLPGPTIHLTHTTFSPCLALVMPFSQDTLLDLSMTLTRLSGAKSLCDPLVAQLLAEWVASSPLAKARWAEDTEVGYPTFIGTKQLEEVEQYASFLFPAPNLLGLLMDLNAPRVGFRTVSEYMIRRGAAYTAAIGNVVSRPIPTRENFLDAWKETAKPFELRPPVSIACSPEQPVFVGAGHRHMTLVWIFRQLVRRLISNHGMRKGSWGWESNRRWPRSGAQCRAPPWHQCQSVSVLRSLPALNLLGDPRDVRCQTGHYLVLLQHWFCLKWVQLWRVGKAYMFTPHLGNILAPGASVQPQAEESYEGDTRTRGIGLRVAHPKAPTKIATTGALQPAVGAAEVAAGAAEAPSAATHFK